MVTTDKSMSYTIQYLAEGGEWRSDSYMLSVCNESNLVWLCVDFGAHAQAVESYAECISEFSEYRNTPIRTLYGDSLSPVSVYVNGVNVRDAWVDKDMGHPHLHTTVLAIRARHSR